MIVVCEPQCKAFSHEKCNSGFLYGLRLAFPQEKIRFYGDATHIDALKKILSHDKVTIENIEYVPVRFKDMPSIFRMVGYWNLFSKILRQTVVVGEDRVFFLSFSPEILYLLKKLKQKGMFRAVKFALVLHGGFESVADGDGRIRAEAPQFPRSSVARSFIEKARHTKFADIPAKALRVCVGAMGRRFSLWSAVSGRFFTYSRMLMWKHSDDFRYICLSSHVKRNAQQYLNVDVLNFCTVTLPTVFADVVPPPRNNFAKFATFGYGNSSALHSLLSELSRKGIDSPYEIRIIGMDNRGAEGFPNVTCTSRGRPLDRVEMERHALDIDMFLILYDKTRYRLSCSGSIMEALSYLKPVLYLDNECVNNFNEEKSSIGIRCDSIQSIANKMQDIAERYSEYSSVLNGFRENMIMVRDKVSIEQSVDALRASFTW